MQSLAWNATPPYPVLAHEDAVAQADEAVAAVGAATAENLGEQLFDFLRHRISEPGARELSQDAVALYGLLCAQYRDGPRTVLNPGALHRALVLCMTRPADDPRWCDYQEVLATIDELWRHVTPGLLRGAFRRGILRTGMNERIEQELAREISVAKRRFRAAWGNV
jgi:hypothetical protein